MPQLRCGSRERLASSGLREAPRRMKAEHGWRWSWAWMRQRLPPCGQRRCSGPGPWRRMGRSRLGSCTSRRGPGLARQAAHPGLMSMALVEVEWIALYAADYESANVYFEELLALSRENGDDTRVWMTLNHLNWSHFKAGHYPEAIAILE